MRGKVCWRGRREVEEEERCEVKRMLERYGKDLCVGEEGYGAIT